MLQAATADSMILAALQAHFANGCWTDPTPLSLAMLGQQEELLGTLRAETMAISDAKMVLEVGFKLLPIPGVIANFFA